MRTKQFPTLNGEPMTSDERIQAIRDRLTSQLTPSYLQITDDSHKHLGHVGAQSGAGHFQVDIASLKFQGQTTIKCHRLVYDCLTDLIGPEIHALSIQLHKN